MNYHHGCNGKACPLCDSMRWLYQHLTNEQGRQLRHHEYFVVKGSSSGAPYRICNGGAVQGHGHTYCLHVLDEHGYYCPPGDDLLGKKILLECNENLFLQTANVM